MLSLLFSSSSEKFKSVGSLLVLDYDSGGPYFIIFFQILDLVPRLAHLYFQEKLPVTLSYVQAAVLLYIGMLGQDISCIQVCFHQTLGITLCT